MHIRTKIVWSNAMVVMIPLGMLAIYSVLGVLQDSHRQQARNTSLQLHAADERIQTFVTSVESGVNFLASSKLLWQVDETASAYLGAVPKLTDSGEAGGVESELFEFYESFKAAHPFLVDIYFGTRFGGLIATNDDLLSDFDPRERPWYQGAIAAPGRVIMSSAYVGTIGEPMVSMAKAVSNPEGDPLGVQSVDVTLRTLTEMVDSVRFGESGYMLLIDEDGTVLADANNADNLFKKTDQIDSALFRAISGSSAASMRVASDKGSTDLVVLTSVNLGWKLVAVIDSGEAHAPAYTLAGEFVKTAVIILILSIAIAVLMARRIIRPVNDLADAMRNIAQGDPGRCEPIEIADNDEIGTLVKWFNQFLSRLRTQRADELQAQKMESVGLLAAGMAHEINTPTQFIGDNVRFLDGAFTDIRGLLDAYGSYAALAPNDPARDECLDHIRGIAERIDLEYLLEEVPSAITQSVDGTDRIATIIRAMKEFSHPGSDKAQPENLNEGIRNTVVVAQSEWKCCAELVLELEPDLPPVECFLSDINQAVLNIVVNAAHAITDTSGEHSDTLGTITIGTRTHGDNVIISIDDTGGGISPEYVDKIFDPFFTTKEVGRGTGQGLSIAYRSIVGKHGGKLTVRSRPGEGTTFLIELPFARSCATAKTAEVA